MAKVSFAPSTFIEGGLAIDDSDIEVANAAWCYFDYGGKSEKGAALCLGVSMRLLSDGTVHDQYFSAGDVRFFAPSTDGNVQASAGPFLVPLESKAQMNKNTNAAMFLASLVNCGFPEARLNGDLGIDAALVGTKMHVVQVNAPERKGLIKTGAQANKQQTVLVVSKLLAMPGGSTPTQTPGLGMKPAAPAQLGGGQPGIPAATPVAPVQVGAAVNGELDTLCSETLIGILAVAGGAIPKSKLLVEASKALTGNPMRQAACQRIFQDAFLSTAEGIKFDGANVSLA